MHGFAVLKKGVKLKQSVGTAAADAAMSHTHCSPRCGRVRELRFTVIHKQNSIISCRSQWCNGILMGPCASIDDGTFYGCGLFLRWPRTSWSRPASVDKHSAFCRLRRMRQHTMAGLIADRCQSTRNMTHD